MRACACEAKQQRGTTAQFKALSLEGQESHRGGSRAVAERGPDARDAERERPVAVARQRRAVPGWRVLGMTNVDFVADGEQFALFLSVADLKKDIEQLEQAF